MVCKKRLSPPGPTMAPGNLVNLEKTAEMSPLKMNSKLAAQNKTFDNFGRIHQLNFP